MKDLKAALVGFTMLFTLIAVSDMRYSDAMALGVFLLLISLTFVALFRLTRRDFARVISFILFSAACASLISSVGAHEKYATACRMDKITSYETGTVTSVITSDNRVKYAVKSENGYKFIFAPDDGTYAELYERFEGKVKLSVGLDDDLYAEPCGQCTFSDTGIAPRYKILHGIRSKVSRWIDETADTVTAPVIKSMVLGDRSDVDADISNSFKYAGMAHVLVVSGAHLSSVVMLITCMFSIVRMKKRNTVIPACLLMLAYMLMSGFGPSVVRAGVCTLLMLSIYALSRDLSAVNSLGVTATVVCLISPVTAVSIGFQLSFFSTFGIVTVGRHLLSRIISSGIPKWLRGIISVIAVTFSAQLFTLPICLMYFGNVPIYSLISNMIASWAVGALVVTAMISAILSLIMLYPIAYPLAFLSDLLTRYIVIIAKYTAKLPSAYFDIPNMATALLLIALVAFTCATVLSGRKKRALLILSCGALILTVTVCLYCHFFCIEIASVGKNCVIIFDKDRATAVGTGNSENECRRAMDILDSRGITYIDGVIVLGKNEKSAVDMLQHFNAGYVVCGESEEISRVAGNAEILRTDDTGRMLPGCTVGKNSSYATVTAGGIDITVADHDSEVRIYNVPDLLICSPGCKGRARCAIVRSDTKILALSAERVYNAGNDDFTVTVDRFGNILDMK